MAFRKMTEKHQAMEYVLYYEFSYQQNDIAKLMGVSASTISTSIKEFAYKRQINDLNYKLEEAHRDLEICGIVQPRIELFK